MKRKRMAIVDFDDTLIREDSFSYMMRKEKWFLDPTVMGAGIQLAGCLALKRDSLSARSWFKEKLLRKYAALPASAKGTYVRHFQEEINQNLVDHIAQSGYDRVVIASASETGLIREVLDGILKVDLVIANELPGEVSCSPKKKPLSGELPIPGEPDKQSDRKEETETISGESGMKTGKFRTCWGVEKAERFVSAVPSYRDYERDAYSDSMSDQPLFQLCDHAFLVGKDGSLQETK